MLQRLASIPVVKSGLSLMTGTMLTSVLGLVFWVLAARLYDTSYFGVNATAIYTMMMLADLACIGLRMGIVRFLPLAGQRTTKTILVCYGIVFASSAATATVFLAGLNLWAPRLIELRSSILLFAFFTTSTAFWGIFMLQDGVLVGLRKATWVPVENTIFGLLKIVLLFPFASISPTLGILWAWTLPVFPIVVAINAMIARVLPGHTAELKAAAAAESPIESATPAQAVEQSQGRQLLREMVSFSLADWVGSVARLAALGVIPLMVLAALGETETGYFQAGWLIAFAVFTLSANAAYALLAENSYDQHKAKRNSMQAVYLSLALTLPIVVVGGLGAPLLLAVYGAEFSANSSGVLRLFLLAAVPNAIYQVFIGHLRSESKMGWVVAIETLLSILVVSMVWLFLPRFGIEGVAVAWFIGVGIMALYAVAVESQWWWVSRIDTRLVRRAGSVVRRVRGTRPSRGLAARLRAALAEVGQPTASAVWSPGDHDCQSAVIEIDGDRTLHIDFARSEAGATELERIRAAIAGLAADPRLVDLHHLLPAVEAHNRAAGREHLAWRTASGPNGLELVEAGVPVETVAHAALQALEPLHRTTAATVVADEDLVETWIERPLARLATTGRVSDANIAQLRRALTDGFVGSTVEVGHIHGGLSLDNITVRSHDAPDEVVGIARWERSAPGLPIVLDRVMLTLSDLFRSNSAELGSVICDALERPEQLFDHPVMVDSTGRSGPTSAGSDVLHPDHDPARARAVLLLAWLHYIGWPLAHRTASGEEFWLARNAQPVLASLDRGLELSS
jgi:O-antigen/teichoic acid export membrane protein